MPGQDVSTGSGDIAVAVKRDPTFSNEIIQMYQLSIKNKTNDWLELDGAKLTAGKEVEVLVGDHIESWVEACALEKKVTDYNLSLVLGAVAVGGAAVAGASNHQQTSNTGAIVALGSIGALAVRDYQRSKNKVDFQKAFPEKHIFRTSMLPPGKVVQRWILVENRKQEDFTLSFSDGVAVTIEGKKSY
jgi:hypothetical protein